MVLIKCYECSKDISDKAENCPNCGAPKSEKSIIEENRNENISKVEPDLKEQKETLEQESSNLTMIRSIFLEYLNGLRKTIHYAIMICFLITVSIYVFEGTGIDEISELLNVFSLEGFQITLIFLSNYLWIYLLYFFIILHKNKDGRLNLIISKIMSENSIFGNAIRRFLEIRRIDSLNWVLVFVYLLSIIFLMINLQGGILEIEPIFSAIMFGLALRLIFLLYYFFGKFTNTRFNIITLILICITIYAVVNPI